MKLYLLNRKDWGNKFWDVTIAIVIAAEYEKEAIDISYEEWNIEESEIVIKELGIANSDVEKGIILRDYVSG